MSRVGPEKHGVGRSAIPSRLRQRALHIPDDVLSQGTDASEVWLQEHSEQRLAGVERDSSRATRLRRVRREFREMRSTRRKRERIILAQYPLMAEHEDGRHIFFGTDLDQQFSP